MEAVINAIGVIKHSSDFRSCWRIMRLHLDAGSSYYLYDRAAMITWFGTWTGRDLFVD